MYNIETNTNKGRCLVASSTIPPQTVIIKEYPFLVAEDAYDAIYQMYLSPNKMVYSHARELFNELSPTKLDKYVISYDDIITAVQTLPQYMQHGFLHMSKNKLRLYVAKFYRNAFNYTSPPCVLLAEGSLLNHSCDNNVDFEIDKNGCFIFTSNREIHVGDEICDSYLSARKSKECLLYQYGFKCLCIKCNVNRSLKMT